MNRPMMLLLRVLCVFVIILAIVVWNWPSVRSIRLFGVGPIGGPPAVSPEEVLTILARRLTEVRGRVEELKGSLARTAAVAEELSDRSEAKSRELTVRRDELLRYTEFVNAGEGIVLSDGRYVPEVAVRERAIFRRAELVQLARELDGTRRVEAATARLRGETERLLKAHQQNAAELSALHSGLTDAIALLARHDIDATTQLSATPTLADLRDAARELQDVAAVHLEMLEEQTGPLPSSGRQLATDPTG